MTTESTHWAATEFAQLDLGDARLDKRARILMERLAADPMASVPKACRGWGETMGAYRFFGNDSVDWRDILAPHWQQTQQRMRAQPVVLCLQDTTELDFNGQGAIGLGPLSYEAQRGMYLHVRRESRRIRCFTADVGGRKPGVPSPVVYRCMRGW